VYDASSGEITATLTGGSAGDGHVCNAFSADGQHLISTHGHVLSLWDAPFAEPYTVIPLDGPTSGWTLCWMDAPGQVAVGTWEGTIEVWDTAARKHLRTLAGHSQIVTSLTNGPKLQDGTSTLVSSSMEGLVKVWNPVTGACLLTLNPEAGAVVMVAASPDRQSLISSHEDGTIGVWDLSYFKAHIDSAAKFHGENAKTP
jgi:WD40 repeat protein